MKGRLPMRKYICLFICLIGVLPISVFAYSDKVILGGESIGIQIDTPGVMVIGFYKVNGDYIKGVPEIKPGDLIVKVNDQSISTIHDLTSQIEKDIKDEEITLTVKRGEDILPINLQLEKVDGVYKTGLYVKDRISGIGTLTYIDPTSKVYGALGHEILESTTSEIVEVKTGSIFESTITSIQKSTTGVAGAKNVTFNYENVLGDIKTNGTHGIYGIYEDNLNTSYIDIAKPSEVKIGKATIYTVLNGEEKKEFEIEITSIKEYSNTKNLQFTITDKELIDKTGGVVQGMSGSPIVQDGKLIGAVTHVIVDDPLTGYGIFITTMLETGDEILKE